MMIIMIMITIMIIVIVIVNSDNSDTNNSNNMTNYSNRTTSDNEAPVEPLPGRVLPAGLGAQLRVLAEEVVPGAEVLAGHNEY